MTNKILEVYQAGTLVKLTETLEAKIVTVNIRRASIVTYECSWWTGESRTREWFYADDFLEILEDKRTKKQKIGFKTYDE
tara:strand:+ start:3007 stop:3246 length:240 start_codon:yes stop_codon:yes gene_type:complete